MLALLMKTVEGEGTRKQRDTAMSQVDAKSLALDIDWGTTFEGVGNVLKDVAKETLGKVETYMKTAEFKALSAENKRLTLTCKPS